VTTQPAPTPADGGGNVKYVIIGLMLIAAAVGVFLMMGPCAGPGTPQPALPDAGVIQRSTSLAQPDIEIPDLEPDAGPEVDAGRRIRYVTRYVSGDWECSGSVPQGAAQGVIREHRRQVRSCYERQLKQNHTLAGNLSLRLKVGPDGSVVATAVGGSLRDPVVFGCVRNLASSWRFPAPTGGNCAVVSAPFAFTPQE